MSRIKFGIIGGDYRYKILFDMLKTEGYDVKVYLNDEINAGESSLSEFADGIDSVIAPIPCTKDNKTVFLPKGGEALYDDLFRLMYKNGTRLFFGGVIPKEIKIKAVEYGINCYDFFEQESVAVLNAIPTAEGAIQSAMQESEECIFASSSLVLGYGRCGKILANMLKGIGANVTVACRSEKDEAYIKAFGCKCVRFSGLECVLGGFDFIFNTVPAQILDRRLLKAVDKKAIIIDIAQAPGGVDYSFARDINLKALYCPGLPGRVAPYTAADILKGAVLNICLSQLA